MYEISNLNYHGGTANEGRVFWGLGPKYQETINTLMLQTCFCILSSERPTTAILDTADAARRPITIPIPRAGNNNIEPTIRWKIKRGLVMTDGKEQLNGSQTHKCSSQHLAWQKSQTRGLQTESDVVGNSIMVVSCIFVSLSSFYKLQTMANQE